jgi:hypothetical protein
LPFTGPVVRPPVGRRGSSPHPAAARFDALEISEADRRKIGRTNAERLLGL